MGDQTSIDRAWTKGLFRGEGNAPMVSRLFVFEYACSLRLVDLRSPEQGRGLLGHLPGSRFLSEKEIEGFEQGLPIVLISDRGGLAGEVASRLEKQGVQRVAAMEGGLVGWRSLGFDTSRSIELFQPGFDADESSPRSSHEHVTLEDVRDHVARVGSVYWVQVGALGFHANTSCVDGRGERRIIGAPGGDMGEFVLTLGALEGVTGTTYTREQVQGTLLAHVDTFGGFYMHSDGDALHHLIGALRDDPFFAGRLPAGEDLEVWQDFIASPPADLHDALKEYLVQPDNLGCGHLRQMCLHPQDYGVRPGLVSDSLRSFFRLLWAGAAEMRYVLLFGGHREGAVVNVRVEEDLWTMSFVPVLNPSLSGHQVFVNHPDVATFKRKSYVRFHCGAAPINVQPDQAEALEQAIARLAARQLQQTLGALAAGLPIYDVTWAADRTFGVIHVGNV